MRRRLVTFSVWGCFAAMSLPGAAAQQPERTETKLTAHDANQWDTFGWSVAAAGDSTVVVGAYGDSALGDFSGSAYVFERVANAWTEVAKLTPNDGKAYDAFGSSVAAYPETIVIGQANHMSSGSAYVYDRIGGAWVQTAKLVASTGNPFDDFGSSVAIGEDTIAVGAPVDSDLGFGAGAVYVFERSGDAWTEVAKLRGEYGSRNFGLSIALSADTMVIGAAFDDYGGSAYVFERVNGTWQHAAQLRASDGSFGDVFGYSVSINAATIVVGAPSDDLIGSVYVFQRAGNIWQQTAKLTPGDGILYDEFGRAVAAGSGTVVVGAPSNAGSGAVYLFKRSSGGWQRVDKIAASDAALGDYFGWSVAASSRTIVVGAPLDTDNGEYSGSAYVLR